MSTITTTVVNGVLPPAQNVADEIAELEKILKLRDEILAGNHPQLTVPAHVLRKVSPASSSQSSIQVQIPIAIQQPSIPLPGLGLAQEEDGAQSQTKPAAVPLLAQPITTASGIHPALLTKSDDLVRAETALHRQRLEKQLRDQFEQKRYDFRKRPAPAEAKPDFDISALVAKALEVVKPVNVSKEQSDKDDENDSFDENSFYSSRAPDSTPEQAEQSQSSQDQDVQEDMPSKHADTAITQPPTGPRRPFSRTRVDPASASKHTANPFDKSQDPRAVEMEDEDEEGEYSPPEPEQIPASNGNSSQAIPDPRSRQMRTYSDLDHNGKRPASPSEPNNMRIVRNHITSPLAPQPSRVSPLALAKDSLVSQGRQYQNGRQRGRAESPSQSPENISVRNKRRKLTRKEEKRQQRRGIKQENISPPPFHDIQPLGSNLSQQDNRPIIIDEPPPAQEIRYLPPAPRYVESPQRPLSRQPEYIPVSEPRISSRTAMRPRDNQDLRRVASMHNMQMEQPREQIDFTPTRQRATSYMRVESPMREVPCEYASDSDGPLQEIRVIRTPAPEYREVYSDSEPVVRYIPMPPPPRERIVVDEYGRRFREIVQERPPVAQQATSSFAPRDPGPPQYYENYSPRAGSMIVEERPAQRYEQDMPPPRVVRQIPEQPIDTPMSGSRESYEPSSGGRMASVAGYDRPPRQVVYADNPHDFRPPVRMASVRPPSSHHAHAQFEEQPLRQMTARAASVRPAPGPPPAREENIFVNERGSSVRREYLPMDQGQPQQPRYRIVDHPQQQQYQPEMYQQQPQPRYVDAQGREMIPAPPQDQGGVRYVQRY